jgi:catechol 2,3-dioxygenase-like lactoylglutathione lyase family enzyme
MRVSAIHHHSVVVTDLSRARAFYRDVLGLREIAAPPNFGGRVAWFALSDQQLHLLHAAHAEPRGERHVALHVDDAAAAGRELAARGIAVEPGGPIPGAERIFIHDPDGNRIELICWRRPWDETVRDLGLTAPTV